LLDHIPRFSVGRTGNIPLTALALRPIGRDEKTSGTFDDPDIMDQKAIVETNGSIGFDQLFVGWTDSNFRDLHLHSIQSNGFHAVSDAFYRPSFLHVSGEKGDDRAGAYDR
jgi:hypothetical protein